MKLYSIAIRINVFFLLLPKTDIVYMSIKIKSLFKNIDQSITVDENVMVCLYSTLVHPRTHPFDNQHVRLCSEPCLLGVLRSTE